MRKSDTTAAPAPTALDVYNTLPLPQACASQMLPLLLPLLLLNFTTPTPTSGMRKSDSATATDFHKTLTLSLPQACASQILPP